MGRDFLCANFAPKGYGKIFKKITHTLLQKTSRFGIILVHR
jgi:hypothetical protein